MKIMNGYILHCIRRDAAVRRVLKYGLVVSVILYDSISVLKYTEYIGRIKTNATRGQWSFEDMRRWWKL